MTEFTTRLKGFRILAEAGIKLESIFTIIEISEVGDTTVVEYLNKNRDIQYHFIQNIAHKAPQLLTQKQAI